MAIEGELFPYPQPGCQFHMAPTQPDTGQPQGSLLVVITGGALLASHGYRPKILLNTPQ